MMPPLTGCKYLLFDAAKREYVCKFSSVVEHSTWLAGYYNEIPNKAFNYDQKAKFSHLSSNFQGKAGKVSLESFIEGTIVDYCNTMARRGTWADNVVIINMAKMLEHDILIVTSSPNTSGNDCLLWVSGDRTGKKAPLLLGHLWENHYQSLQPIEQTGASLKRKQDDDRQLNRDGLYLEISHLLFLQYPL